MSQSTIPDLGPFPWIFQNAIRNIFNYRATSTLRVSRMTVTFTSPG